MSRQLSGLWFAIGAAAAFSFSGSLGSGLMATGWSAGAAACGRILIGALVLLPFLLPSMRGRWSVLPAAMPRLFVYGILAVAGPQLAYFQAVRYLPVAVALLVEFAAPVAVLLWLWVTGGQRPSWATSIGAVVAVAGLVVVLDLGTGAVLNLPGILWALAAMVGLAIFFVLSSGDSRGLPPVAFATGGQVVAGTTLGLAGAAGIIDLEVSRLDPMYAGQAVPWWLALLVLGAVSSGLAYALAIAGARRLGPRLAGFVGLTEVLFVAMVAWLLLGEAPTLRHAFGGALVLAGVALVKLGEPATVHADGAAAPPVSTA